MNKLTDVAPTGTVQEPFEVNTTACVAGLIVRLRVAVPVPPALVALIVTLVVPLAVGVPVMAPVEVLTDNPAGSPVAL
jgi:hypothetical protein